MAKRTNALERLTDGRRARLEAVEQAVASGRKPGEIDRDLARRFGVSANTIKADRKNLRSRWRTDGKLYEPGDRRGAYCQRLDDLAEQVAGWLDAATDEGLASKVRAAEALFKLYQERARIDGVTPATDDGGGSGDVTLHVHLGRGPAGAGDDA